MAGRIKNRWLNLTQGLGFVPGLIVFAFALLGIFLVELDGHLDLNGVDVIFQGDGSAARTVLSVIAGSLITVAGLTFSITIVVLQQASSQFSPRVLRTFFGDRVTQVTIGTFVGTFVYSILVLRAVGSFGDTGFVPRLSVTIASLFGIGAVVLLIVYLNHVSQMIQVSHVTANIARETLARTDVLYPEEQGEPVEEAEGDRLVASWRSEEPGRVTPPRPGFVQRVNIKDMAAALEGRADRIAIRVSPGDFISIESPIAEVWPAGVAEECEHGVLSAVSIASERDIAQDVDFGVRQLADIALKAVSPGLNDPTTAVTCIGYLRSILVRLSERPPLASVRRFPDGDGELVVVARQRLYGEYLDSIAQINRYAAGDAWVISEMLSALQACAEAAEQHGYGERVRAAQGVAEAIAEQAATEVKSDRDRVMVREAAARVSAVGAV